MYILRSSTKRFSLLETKVIYKLMLDWPIDQKFIGQKWSIDLGLLRYLSIRKLPKYFVSVKNLAFQFPELVKNICGEESNTFSNTLGQIITVTVLETEDATAALLCCVLNGNVAAARLLAAEVHRNIDLSHLGYDTDIPKDDDLEIPLENIAVWIDPIDSTAEYINGTMTDWKSTAKAGDFKRCGLECVTVLIGAYNISTGAPIMGVINQPFYEESKGRCIWGMTWNGKSFLSRNLPKSIQTKDKTTTVIISSSESEAVKNALQAVGYVIIEAAGAGYKLLTVVLGETDVYLLTKATAYKWDTCGPHAVLAALGGGLVDCSLARMGIQQQITYNNKTVADVEDVHSHAGGIVAYRDQHLCSHIVALITNEDI